MKEIIIYIVEVIIAGILLFVDQRIFLLYFFMVTIYYVNVGLGFLRKMIRVNGIIDEVKLRGIVRKLDISQDDLGNILEEIVEKTPQSKIKSLEKDLRDLGINLILR